MKTNQKLQNFTNILSNIFLVCLGLLAFQSIFGQAIFGFEMANYSLGNFILSFIEKVQYMIVILAIVSGALVFYVNRGEVESIEEERGKGNKNYLEIIILTIIIILGFIIKIYIAGNNSPDTDEIYTYMVIEGFNKYGEINITTNGNIYNQTPLFHYCSAIFYNFFKGLGLNELLSLRIFNIILSSILVIPFYFLTKKVFNKNVALLSIVILTFSWFITIISFTARTYVTFGYLIYFGALLFLLSYKNINKLNYKKGIIYITLSFILGIYNFIDGHILGLYHLLILYIIGFLFIIKQNLKNNFQIIKKIFFIMFGILLILYIYIFFFKYSYIEFIINSYNPIFRENVLSIGLSIYGYSYLISIIIFSLSLIYILLRKNNEYKILIFFIITILILQGFIFGKRFFNFKYLIDILILSIPFLSYLLIYLYRNHKNIFLIGLTLILISNIFNLNNLGNDKLSWGGKYNDTNIKLYKKCNSNDIIITDSPSVYYFYNKLFNRNNKIYSLKSKDDNYHYKKSNQYYYKYLNIKALTSLDYFKKISINNNICFIVSHNVYNSTHKFGNEILFNYVINNGKEIYSEKINKVIYNNYNQKFGNKNNGTVILFDKSMIK